MSDINAHQVITAFDIHKDAKVFKNPSIISARDTLLQKCIMYISSKAYDKNLSTDYETIKKRAFASGVITKTPITRIKKIQEKQISKINEKIVKDKPKMLKDKKFLFYDAGTGSKEFCCENEEDKQRYYYCETIASYIDPATRPNKEVYIDFDNNDFDLHSYGIGNSGSKITIQNSIIIITFYPFNSIIKKIIFTAEIKNNDGDLEKIKITIKHRDDTEIEYNSEYIIKYLLKGNHTKNTYVNQRDDVNVETILLFLFKELGDTFQAIILKKIIEDQKPFNTITLTRDNCCLTTNDTVLFIRSKLLNIPVLLYNCGLVRYYGAIHPSQALKNELIHEVNKVISINDKTIEMLTNISENKINFKIRGEHDKIKLNLEKEILLDDEPSNIKEYLLFIINNIKIVNAFLTELQSYIFNLNTIFHDPDKLTIRNQLQSIQAENLRSIKETYARIVEPKQLSIADLENIKKKINGFRSLFLIKLENGDFKINYSTKSIFSNSLILLDNDTILFKLIKQSGFYINGQKKYCTFAEWVSSNKLLPIGGTPEKKSGTPSPMDIEAPQSPKYEFLYSVLTYELYDDDNILPYIFLYEHIYNYIDCYPELISYFQDKNKLEDFINISCNKRKLFLETINRDILINNFDTFTYLELEDPKNTLDSEFEDNYVKNFLQYLENLYKEGYICLNEDDEENISKKTSVQKSKKTIKKPKPEEKGKEKGKKGKKKGKKKETTITIKVFGKGKRKAKLLKNKLTKKIKKLKKKLKLIKMNINKYTLKKIKKQNQIIKPK